MVGFLERIADGDRSLAADIDAYVGLALLRADAVGFGPFDAPQRQSHSRTVTSQRSELLHEFQHISQCVTRSYLSQHTCDVNYRGFDLSVSLQKNGAICP